MTSRERLPHLFDHWDAISRRVLSARRIELFLDFDGTLVDFRFGPDQVSLGKEARSTLGRLVRHPCMNVAIVSGRRSAALRRFVKVPGVRFMGLYGWEDGTDCHLPSRTIRKLSAVREALAKLSSDVPGIRVEDKGFSLAVHFRGATAIARRRAGSRMRRLARRFRGDLRIFSANSVWDIVPHQVRGKGAAIRRALARISTKTLPIFLGDDLTDEPAFAALPRGITVLVGPGRPTRARFRLRDPDEVRQFLKRLEEALREKS